jgi:hypothetical protein
MRNLLLILVLATVAAFEPDSDTFPFAADNKCSACLVGGNTFCVYARDNTTVKENELMPKTRCC